MPNACTRCTCTSKAFEITFAAVYLELMHELCAGINIRYTSETACYMVMWIRLCLVACCFVGVVRCKSGLQDQLSKDPFGQVKKDQSKCSVDLSYAQHSITKEKWAMQMVDAFGKLDTGLVQGRETFVGNYDECLEVVAPPGAESSGFKGQYCWMAFSLQINSTTEIPLMIGGCFPNSCHAEEIMKHYDEFPSPIGPVPAFNGVFQKMNLTNISCVREDKAWSTRSIIFMAILAFVISMVIVATGTDLLQKKWANQQEEYKKDSHQKVHAYKRLGHAIHAETGIDEEKGCSPLMPSDELKVDLHSHHPTSSCMELLLCFSASKHSSDILNVRQKAGQLDCLNGIRCFSIISVIVGHIWLFGFQNISNPLEKVNVGNTLPFQVIWAGTYCVDSFIFLSGFLLTYMLLKNDSLPKTIGEWISLYIHRYIRLTPAYVMILLLWMVVWDYPTSGPFWDLDSNNENNCKKYWWRNLLYINNLQDVSEVCIGSSWYLSLDMQLFIISPLFLVTLKRWPRIGMFLVISTTIASVLGIYFVSYTNHLVILGKDITLQTLSPHNSKNILKENADIVHYKPYFRIGPYLIGMLFAYFVLCTRNRKDVLNKRMVRVGWISATASALFLVYGIYYFNPGHVVSAAYIAFSRSAWALCLGWIVFACQSGYGGVVNDILSIKYFGPLSRLTYCVYLLQDVLITLYSDTLKDTLPFSANTFILLCLAFSLLSFLTAFVATLLIELPFVCLEKQMTKIFRK